MREKTLDVIVAGDLFVDLIMSGFASWPTPGTEAFARGFQREVGGGVAITACGLAKLGSRTAALSVVGDDNGAWVAERLERCGVDTSELRFDETEPTACTVAVSMPEDRTFLTYQGANQGFPKVIADVAKSGGLSRARHVHLGWAPPLDSAEALLTAIRSNGCSVSLDTGWHEKWLEDSRAMALLPKIDIFFPSEVEAGRMTGASEPEECLRRFQAAGARKVALKLGSAGAALLWDGDLFRVQPHAVTPVDTIGAGDSFDAGFLHYLLAGAAPLTCLRAANFCGAASTEAYGGIEAFPAASRVTQAIEDSL